MHVRVCPECGEEFRPEIAACSDCGATLVDRHEGEGPEAPYSPSAATLVTPRAIAHARDVRDLVPLAEALRAAGLACRLTHASKERDPAGFDLEVAEAEFLKALAVLDLVPGHDMFLVEARPAPEGGLGESHCPACGTELAEGVLQCLECGLILGSGHEPPPS